MEPIDQEYNHNKRRMIKKIIFLSIVLPGAIAAGAQNRGLVQKQDPATLPLSSAVAPVPLKKQKTLPLTQLVKKGGSDYVLTNGWEMQAAAKVNGSGATISKSGYNSVYWYYATVPGTVLTTLVDQGVYADPYFGLNNLSIPDTLCRQEWWYRTSFKIPKAEKSKRAWLNFNGINYKADIWLNGKRIGTLQGAFQRGRFDITPYLQVTGENTLAVHIFPPPHPGIPHEQSPSAGPGPNGGTLALDGPTFISSEGWDWVPGMRDRNIGIWQNVALQFSGNVTIVDPQVITDLPLPDTSSAAVTVKATLHNSSNVAQVVLVRATIENVSVTQKVQLGAGATKKVAFTPQLFPALNIKNPRLWWPNGYGKPELYNVHVTVQDDDGKEDSRTVRFGIRELSYELTVDAPKRNGWRIEFDPTYVFSKTAKPLFDNVKRRHVVGETYVPSLREGVDTAWLKPLSSEQTAPYLVIQVNGKRIFCKGGNWGMDDGMKRVTRERLEPYFKLHRDANFNMVRNWTGESTEELFYDLCDEYGLLVWNDFWLSTEGYNLDPLDNALFLTNAKDVITRFRNHPSIALWCPRNEGYAPASLEDSLAYLVATVDGTRHYHANSRYLNLRTSGPWHYLTNPAEYFTKVADGFSTELGTPSVPTAASMRKMMAKEDVWPISDVWYYHDLHDGQKSYRRAIDSLYGVPETLEDFCKKAQMVNFDSHRAMFEAWNSKLWNSSSGLLLWMSHPAWPSTVWQVYSWDYETFGSYFASKRACEPVHVQMNLDDNQVVAVNTSLQSIEDAAVIVGVFDLQGKKLYEQRMVKNVSANQLTPFFIPDLPSPLPAVYLLRVQLLDKAGLILSQNDYWKNGIGSTNFLSFNELEKATLKAEVLASKNGRLKLQLTNTSAIPAVSIKLNLVDSRNNIVLPTYFSDGYFNLLPGEKKTIFMTSDEGRLKQAASIVAEGYNIPVHGILDFKAI